MLLIYSMFQISPLCRGSNDFGTVPSCRHYPFLSSILPSQGGTALSLRLDMHVIEDDMICGNHTGSLTLVLTAIDPKSF